MIVSPCCRALVLVATLVSIASVDAKAGSIVITNVLADHYAPGPLPDPCPQGPDIRGIPVGHRIERPHWLHNDRSGLWVLWAHYEAEGYGTAEALVATAPDECGPYRIVRTFRPLNREVRDDFLYKDEDGTAWFLAASRKDDQANDTLAIFRLTADYTDVDAEAGTQWAFENQYREAPVVVKRDGIYFLLTSQAAGWFPSQGLYATATSMAGPWSPLAPFGNSSTFGGQTTDVREFRGKAGIADILVLDHLGGNDGQDDGRLLLPLLLDPAARTATLDWYSWYSLDATAGLLRLPRHDDLVARRPAMASSTAVGSRPENASDEDYHTEWVAGSDFPAWWMTDLGSPTRVGEIDISWWMVREAEAIWSYYIEYSLDGRDFTRADRPPQLHYGFTVDKLDVTARYVRIRLDGVVFGNNKRERYVPRIWEVSILP